MGPSAYQASGSAAPSFSAPGRLRHLCSADPAAPPGSRLLTGSIFSALPASAVPCRPSHGCVMQPGCSVHGQSEPGYCDRGRPRVASWPHTTAWPCCGCPRSQASVASASPVSVPDPSDNRTHFLLPLLPMVGGHVALVTLQGGNCLGIPWFGIRM